MDKLTNNHIVELYKKMGLKDPKFFNGVNAVNLFKILDVEPQIKEDGTRLLTPYEVLGVLPKFENGEEKPIVFAIKNRIKRIGKYEGQIVDFVYKKSKIKEEKSVMQTLKERYRAAVFAGNEDEAESCLKMMESLSSSEAREFKDSFYDYSKFYKRMKKQLLLDLFAHFFLIYVQTRSSIIKSGIIKKNNLYKAYREKKSIYNQDVTFGADSEIVNVAPQIDPVAFGLQNIKKVVINNKEMDSVAQFDISEKEIMVKTTESLASIEPTFVPEPQIQKSESIAKTSIVEQNAAIAAINESFQEQPAELPKFSRGIFKSFLKKKKKAFHKIGPAPIYEGDVVQEEKSPYSIMEKSFYRENEREIEI